MDKTAARKGYRYQCAVERVEVGQLTSSGRGLRGPRSRYDKIPAGKGGADINTGPGKYHGKTALQAVAGNQYFGGIELELLLERGADVNAPPSETWSLTALQAAGRAENLDNMELLLERGLISRLHQASVMVR